MLAACDMAVELIKRGETTHFFPKGHSMSPLIRPYEEVLVTGVTPSDLRVGDIVVVDVKSGRLVIHRLTRLRKVKGRMMAWTKGDGGLRWDQPVDASLLVGRAVAVIRGGKRYINLDTPYWRMAGYLAAQFCLLQTIFLRIPGFGVYTPRNKRNILQRFWLHTAKIPFRFFVHVCLWGDRLRSLFGKEDDEKHSRRERR